MSKQKKNKQWNENDMKEAIKSVKNGMSNITPLLNLMFLGKHCNKES